MRKLNLAIILFIVAMLTVPSAYVCANTNLTSTTNVYNNFMTVVIHAASTPVLIDPSTPDYGASEGTETYNGTEYDTVTISSNENEQGGIADDDGNVDVSFDIDNGRPFCIRIHHTALDLSILYIYITINGQTKQYNTSWTLTASDQYFGQANKYSSLNALNNANDWIQSNSVINVQITDSYGFVPDGVTLKVLFKPD